MFIIGLFISCSMASGHDIDAAFLLDEFSWKENKELKILQKKTNYILRRATKKKSSEKKTRCTNCFVVRTAGGRENMYVHTHMPHPKSYLFLT